MKILLIFLFTFLQTSDVKNGTIKPLYALVGLWKMSKTGGDLYENWTKANNTRLSGKSYFVKETDTTFLEEVNLRKVGNSVVYVPLVAGQSNGKAVVFTLISSKENNFIFENKLHDFPQRVQYRLVNSDSMVARIEGLVDGKEKSTEFYYSRVY